MFHILGMGTNLQVWLRVATLLLLLSKDGVGSFDAFKGLSSSSGSPSMTYLAVARSGLGLNDYSSFQGLCPSMVDQVKNRTPPC